MPKRRFGTFSGGIDLPDEKDATLSAPITPIGPVERLTVPLAPVKAEPAVPVVELGTSVSAGGLLAESRDPKQINIHAPLKGVIGRIVDVMLPDSWGGWRKSPAVEILQPGKPRDIEPLLQRYEWQRADAPSLRDRIALGQILTSEPLPIRLADWIDAARDASVTTLIANVMENTPFIAADHRLLSERGSEVVRGLVILARSMEVDQVILAVDGRRIDGYRSAVEPAELYGIDPIALAHKYPIGSDAILVKVLTRRAVPLGGKPSDIGVAVIDASTCWAIFRSVACEQHQSARVVTVAGDRVGKGGNYLVPFGTPLADVLAAGEPLLNTLGVVGSAMTGRALVEGSVAGSGTPAVLGLHVSTSLEPTVCIRCGWCVENCPARLNVAELNDDFELGRVERAERRGVIACVACGVCSYVCPARLPLARRMGLLSQAIIEERTEPVSAS